MFQFRRFPTYAYLIQRRLTEYCSAGFPHSDISGSTVICTSPKLFAACHVLHRLLMPRHSPCALSSLTLLSVCTERSRSGSQAFELCRLRVLRNCLCYPSKSSTNHFCFPLLLALHTWLLCSVFKVRFSGFFRNQMQTLTTKCLHPISKEWNHSFFLRKNEWWAQVDSNHRPHDYQSCALAS